MKKSFVFFVFLILSFSLSFAVEDSQIGMDLQEAGKQISEQGKTILSNQVSLPSFLQGPVNVVFGFKERITFDVFVIACVLFITILILMFYLTSLIPFFNSSKITVIISSLAITLLIGVGGGFYFGAKYFLNFGGFFSFLDRWPTIRFFIVIIVIAIIFLGSTRLMRLIKMKLELETAESVGRDFAVGSAFAKLFSKSVGE